MHSALGAPSEEWEAVSGAGVIPEILHAAGITPGKERARFVLQARDGKEMILDLAPLASGGEITWLEARADRSRPPALWRRVPERTLWFEPLDGGRTLYVRLNGIQNTPEETFALFSTRLLSFAESHPVDRLVLDPIGFMEAPTRAHSWGSRQAWPAVGGRTMDLPERETRMIRRNLFRCVAIAALLASLLAPSAALAAPRLAPLLPDNPGRALLAVAWDFLGSLFLAEETDTRGCIDPDGRDLCAGVGAVDPDRQGESLDTRGTIDPNG